MVDRKPRAPEATTAALAALLAEAMAHHEAGRLAAAEALYRRILARDGGHVTALHCLGLALAQRGDYQAAQATIARVLQLAPNWAQAHATMGNLREAQGEFAAAAASQRRALALDPAFAAAQLGLASALQAQGDYDEAAASYRQALTLDPALAEAQFGLGNALVALGRAGEAIAHFERAVALNPGWAEAFNNLGSARLDERRLDAAVPAFERALALKPDYAQAHYNLGNALLAQRRHDEAAASFRRALAVAPDYVEAHFNLGNVLLALEKLGEAGDCFRRALALRPGFAGAHNNLGQVLQMQGDAIAAVASFRRALECELGNLAYYSAVLFYRHYDPAVTPEVLREEHRRYGARVEIFPPPCHANPRESEKRLRIGYVSPDFRRHPVGFFLAPVLAHHDRARFAPCCYYGHPSADAVTGKLKEQAELWRSTVGMSDADLAATIRADGIDILVDLAGHTANNRLPVFARKPAPVQASWAGYVGTTGLSTIDYLISDRWENPPGSESEAVEKLMRLPDGYVCWAPADDTPEVGKLPAQLPGAVTFGCFNAMPKLNPALIGLWSRLLHSLPQARLVLKTRGLQDEPTRQLLLARFAAAGIAASRLTLEGASPHAELLERYNDIDIALDPFPYSGGITTIEALWMGVPVVARAGRSFAGRHSVSHLNVAGLAELVAADEAGYLRIAQDLAADLPRLAALRASLRGRLSACPLLQADRFTRGLEAAFRDMWKRWCASA